MRLPIAALWPDVERCVAVAHQCEQVGRVDGRDHRRMSWCHSVLALSLAFATLAPVRLCRLALLCFLGLFLPNLAQVAA